MRAFAYPFRVAAATAVTLVLLAGCQTTGNTDSSGRVMTTSGWKAVPSQESYLDIPDRLPGIDVKVEKQLRDNSIYQNRLTLDGGKGSIFVQSIVTGGWYNYSSKKRIDDQEFFVEDARRKAQVSLPSTVQPVEIKHASRRAGGWYVTFPGIADGIECIVSKGGYVFRENKYDNDDGANYDTFLFANFCGPEDSVRQIEAMIGTTVPRRR